MAVFYLQSRLVTMLCAVCAAACLAVPGRMAAISTWGLLVCSSFSAGCMLITIVKAGRPWLLAVEDPQEPGTCIGSGSFAIMRVQKRFRLASTALRAALDRASRVAQQGLVPANPANPSHLSDAEAAAWQAVQEDGASRSPETLDPSPRGQRSLLGVVLDVGAALARGSLAEDPNPNPERQRALIARARPLGRSPKRPPGGPPMQRKNPKKRRPAPGPEVDEEGPAAPPARKRRKGKR